MKMKMKVKLLVFGSIMRKVTKEPCLLLTVTATLDTLNLCV